MLSTQTLYLLGTLLVGWLVRHWFPPASAGSPTAKVPGSPTNPVVDALLRQGGTVIESALHDWLANGLPQIAQPSNSLPASAQHPVVSAANNVAAQAAQAASAAVMAQIQQALAQAPVQPLQK